MDIVKKDIGGNAEAEVVLYQPDSSIHIEVLVEGETVWLTTQQMALLFNRDDSNIRRHIINIFRDGELQQENNVHFLHVNGVKKPVPYYNLDVIISVGYRVHSPQGVAFRIWATRIIKQYLLHGFAIRQRFADIQRQIDIRLEEHSSRMLMIEKTQARQQEQLDFFVLTNQPPHEGVVFEGHLLEGREVAESLIKSAKREIVLIDTYVGADTFHILEAREAGVAATIYTEKTGVNIQSLQADHEREYGVGRHIEVMKYRTSFHDRFLIVDEDVYHIGASLKDLGKRLFAFDKMGLSKDLILSQVR